MKASDAKLREQRLKALEDYIKEREMCRLDELCNHFNVSMATMRRDIDILLDYGLIHKVYGGIKLNKRENFTTEPFYTREIKNIYQKEYIATIAANLIKDNETIFLDSGTTSYFITKYIKTKNITVITSNINIINECFKLENINLISIGGILNRITNSFVGEFSEKNLNSYNISKAFIAATGASITEGFTNNVLEETRIKKIAIERSNETYIIIDSSKWNNVSLLTFSELSKVKGVITEKAPPEEFKEYFEKHKVNIYF